MKNILLSGLALASLLFASSCQMDEPDAGKLTGEVDFSITAGVPGSINTYASNDGGATNVPDDTYDQRFILEVYDGDAVAYREEKTVEIGNTASFDVRLLAKKYKMALWADFVENGRTDDNLYNTSNGLDAVTINTDRSAGQEIADAYCHSEEIDLTEGSLSKPITLTRPFGKIRLVSTDNPSNAGATAPASVKVTYGSTIEVPSGYNVLTGEALETKISAGTYSFVPYKEDVSVGGVSKGELYILGIDYIFASRSATNVSFDVKVDGNGARSVSNIPVSANKLTTVIGNFYTNEGSIDVIVEDRFTNGEEAWNEEGAKYVGTVEEVIAAFENGKSIILLNDIQIPENTSISIPSGIVSSIDLNGHILSTTNSEGQQFQEMFEVVGTLNISNGTVQFEYTSENMGWNGGAAVFNVHGGGILNMENVVVSDLGGTDMSFCIHLNNWGDVTLNADNCEFNSPYCGVRVFNSGPDMNNVNITNSKLTGTSRAFWVHNYIGDISNATEEEIKNRLNVDIYNNNNSFILTETAKSPIRYGFSSPIFFDEKGERVMDVWTGDSENPVVDDGAQTVTINSSAQLAGLANLVNTGNNSFSDYKITLNADIDLANIPWTPIGNGSRGSDGGSSFSGVFDGNGHTIRNINVTEDRDNYGAGLFSVVKGGTVKNITVEGGSIKAFDYGAAVVGIMLGESTVENCHARNVEICSDDVAAGIVARAYGTSNTITGCTNSCDITEAKKAGGIVGIASNGGATKIENCSNSGTVYASDAGAAGILGYAGPATNSIISSSNTGTIGRITDKYAGGIVGYQASTDEMAGLIIERCTNSGEISAINAGGIYGIPGSSQPVHITASENNGNVTGIDAAGGIACRAGSGTIGNCTNTATVTASADNKGVAGGVVGNLGEARIILCKGGDASAVISAQYAGRLVGHVSNKPYRPEDVLAELQIDDSNGDYYEGYRTIGAMGLYTSWANINITSGTLHGKPLIEGEASGYIKIHEGASWDAYPDETGTWKCAPTDNNVWTKL